ncbi:MAG TPA: PfkB family carbohydrate kinase [Candidatus Krumholzibacteria bacterium]|nr:PfkB family carbohydrate kinase [Candidatus Krumholzibacteria bacterium]
MKRYLDILDSFAGLRVGVVGDYLLDQYILGTTARVSREAPIVVVDYLDTVYHPGGAANAAQNVTALAGSALATGVLGADREGEVLADLLNLRGVECAGLLRLDTAATSTKMRILAGEMNAQKQQVARVDRSHGLTLAPGERERLRRAIADIVARCGAMLLADYGLGVLDADTAAFVVKACADADVPVVVDSRHRLPAFRGATVATPNEVEAIEALALADERTLTDPGALRAAVAATGIANMIVTRGSKGMVVCTRDGAVEPIGPAADTAATDVTGAGDTVSAVVALSLAAGATVAEAARMASFAASVVVMKRGTATASQDEVRDMINASGDR